MPIKALLIFGTRPEALKLCPVIRHMKSRPDDFDVRVRVTAQHRKLLNQVLNAFERRIVDEAERLLEDPVAYQPMARCHSPYGNGLASRMIASFLVEHLTHSQLTAV